jgi:uncharacterized protein (DUF1499 family)
MRWLLRMLVALLYPACAMPGATGLPIPPLMNMAALHRPGTPNTALAAPAGFQPTPDIVTPAYKVSPQQLFAAIQRVATSAPRSFLQVEYPERLQAHYVLRSDWLNFPDLVTIQVTLDSHLILWSRSVYGRSDLGVNKARLATWLAALDRVLPTD